MIANRPATAKPENRHECKFVIDEGTAARVRRLLHPFVVPDAHALQPGGHGYDLASLYLDDELHTFYRETLDGRPARHKLRIRSYSDDPAAPLFLEVKRRRDRIVQKVRCAIPRDRLPAVLAGDVDRALAPDARGRGALEQFVLAMLAGRATPRCLVRYRREAFVARDDDRVRVTYDRAVAACWQREPVVTIAHPGYRHLLGARVVLELKFTDRLPRWLATTVQACELQRGSCSKYRLAIDTLRGSSRPPAHDD
ncbi:MAG: polyphosphate polymerase domain-containing protein [Planctomycetes bacterium]|nr:polyphosphate polymerase domain-containing protein [Planctomycetota bacterium]